MAIEKKEIPYEILFRFTEDGKIQGGHIGLLRVITDDGEVISKTPQPVQSIALAGEAGFDVAEVSNIINTGLFDQNAALLAEQSGFLEVVQAFSEKVAVLEQEKADLLAEVARVTALVPVVAEPETPAES